MARKTQFDSAIKGLAARAKKRLESGEYSKRDLILEPPKTLTPSEREMYSRLRELYERGEEVVNPVGQLADKEKLDTLPHDERQRYIISLCADYAAMKRELLERLAAADGCGADGGQSV